MKFRKAITGFAPAMAFLDTRAPCGNSAGRSCVYFTDCNYLLSSVAGASAISFTIAISAASPRRGPILKIWVYPP